MNNFKLIWRGFNWKRFHWMKAIVYFDKSVGYYTYVVEKSSGQTVFDKHNYAVSGSGVGFEHYQYKVQVWPKPDAEVPEFTPLDSRWTFYFMDDLKFCPVCHRFHPYAFYRDTQAALENWFATLGLCLPNDLGILPPEITADFLRSKLASRKDVPEFTVALCGGRLCHALQYRDSSRAQDIMLIHPHRLAHLPMGSL